MGTNITFAEVNTDGTGLFLDPQVGGLGGSWFDPQFAGSGFNLIATEDTLSVSYLGYQNSGEPLWLLSAPFGVPTTDGDTFIDIPMFFGDAGSATFKTPQPPGTLTPWGTMTLTFNSCNSISATLDGIDGTISTELTQLLVNQNTSCGLSPAPSPAKPTAIGQQTSFAPASRSLNQVLDLRVLLAQPDFPHDLVHDQTAFNAWAQQVMAKEALRKIR